MYFQKQTIFLLLFLILPSCSNTQKNELLTGADILIRDHLNLLKGKKIGIVTNHTAVLKNGTHFVDSLNANKEINISALFAPEHGIRGTEEAGQEIKGNIDIKTGVPVYSLYTEDKKPTKEMLENVDLLLYDIQDVGVRFYTYISTLFYLLQAAAENNIPVIVLDRPNPIDGVTIEGPVLKEELKSFVGIASLPVRYGMTAGELAKLFSGEGYLGNNLNPDLTVIKTEGWERDSYHSDYDREWISPSPNLPYFESAFVYPGTCLIEGTNVSEGRGTENPFIIIGAPYINSEELVNELYKSSPEGVKFHPQSFTPVRIKGAVENPKYKNEACYGISIEVTDKNEFNTFYFGIKLLSALIKLYPDSFKFTPYFDTLSGNENLREDLLNSKPVEEIVLEWKEETERFNQIRKKYLLY